MFHAAKAMDVNVENCILVDDSSAGAQAGIAAGMEVFYFCADPHTGNTKCLWSFIQHPNIYNPNKNKKASVLDPAWHKLQSTHVCSVVKLLDFLELTPSKDVLFHYRGLE